MWFPSCMCGLWPVSITSGLRVSGPGVTCEDSSHDKGVLAHRHLLNSLALPHVDRCGAESRTLSGWAGVMHSRQGPHLSTGISGHVHKYKYLCQHMCRHTYRYVPTCTDCIACVRVHRDVMWAHVCTNALQAHT